MYIRFINKHITNPKQEHILSLILIYVFVRSASRALCPFKRPCIHLPTKMEKIIWPPQTFSELPRNQTNYGWRQNTPDSATVTLHAKQKAKKQPKHDVSFWHFDIFNIFDVFDISPQ